MAAIPLARTLALVFFLIPAAICDLRTRRIPNRFPAAAFCAHPALLAAEAALVPETIPDTCLGGLLAAALLGALCLLCRALLPRSFGAGDVKLLVLAGLYLGPDRGLAAALFAAAPAAASAAVRRLRPSAGRGERIPLAPFLVPGAAMSLFCHF